LYYSATANSAANCYPFDKDYFSSCRFKNGNSTGSSASDDGHTPTNKLAATQTVIEGIRFGWTSPRQEVILVAIPIFPGESWRHPRHLAGTTTCPV
jgi:hypothetical protein